MNAATDVVDKRMLVVSNMWPDDTHPSSGIFVKRFVDQSKSLGWHCDLAVMRTSDRLSAKVCSYLLFYLVSFFKSLVGRYDVVYVHYPSFSAPAVLLARRLKRFRFFVNVHGSDVLPVSTTQQKMHRYTKQALACADRIVVPSKYFADVVIEKYDVDSGRVFVYPSGGFDPEVFHPLPVDQLKKIKDSMGLNPRLVTVCFAGRITEGKGWDTYLNAIALLISQGLQLNVLLIGSGDQDAQCANLIDELGLREHVIRMGLQPQNRLCELYNVADIFVFPGRRSESLGLVAIEAMACGTPVVASDFSAQKYYINDYINGIKFKINDDVALAAAIDSLVSNTCLRTTLAQGALNEARRYSVQNILVTLSNILNDK